MAKMRDHVLFLLVACMLPAVSASCGDDDDDFEARGLSLATYNAGLAPGFVPLVEERAEKTVEAVAARPVDALCVQELWREQDLDLLLERTEASLPVALAPEPMQPEPEPGAPPACGGQAVEPLSACVAERCGDVPPAQLTSCVLGRCGDAFAATSPDCQRCLAASVGEGVESALRTCTTETGPRFAFGGAFGTALLTEGELLEQDTLVLDSVFNRRAVIYARVNFAGAGELNLFCTHLTPDFETLPFPGEGSFAEVQAVQIESLLAFVEQKTGGQGRTVLMGDFNTGPALDGIAAEVPASYERLIGAGFANPFIDQGDPQCTFCADNPLVLGVDEQDSVLIDHILLSENLEADVLAAERIFTESVEVVVVGGSTLTTLSDHYGVRVRLRIPR